MAHDARRTARLTPASVAVVQAAPVAFDVVRTLEKVRDLAADAGRRGARLTLFPEAFVSAYPRGLDFGAVVGSRSSEGREQFRIFYDSAIDVPGPDVETLATIARDARTWFAGALLVMLVTGWALFSSEAIKCYYNFSFWVKITTLPIAIVFAFLVRDRIAAGAGMRATTLTRVIGLLSIALWFTVAAAGRWIGFS